MMAIALRAAAVGPSVQATSTTINLPTGTTTGDVTIVAAVQTGANTITPPSGWTAILNIPGIAIYWRAFQAGDPSSITFASPAANWWESTIISYSGCDTTAPIDGFASCVFYNGNGNQPASTLYRAPSVNPNFAADQLVCIYAHDNLQAGGTITLPSGLTSRASSSAGPSVCMADKALTDGTPTGNQNATWDAMTAVRQFGAQIALKAAGASPTTVAAPSVGIAGLLVFSALGSITIPLSQLSPQQGDLVVVGTASNLAVTPPSGYTLAQSAGGAALYTHVFNAGDSTSPLFTIGGGGDINAAVFLLRKIGTGTAAPALDNSGVNTATATVSTPSLTPSGSGEMLICFYGNASTLAGSWTATPAGLTNDISSGWGPCLLMGWTKPAANPTGAFSATNSVSATVGAIAALFKVLSSAPTGTAGIVVCVCT